MRTTTTTAAIAGEMAMAFIDAGFGIGDPPFKMSAVPGAG
jgi:hypothetical protein